MNEFVTSLQGTSAILSESAWYNRANWSDEDWQTWETWGWYRHFCRIVRTDFHLLLFLLLCRNLRIVCSISAQLLDISQHRGLLETRKLDRRRRRTLKTRFQRFYWSGSVNCERNCLYSMTFLFSADVLLEVSMTIQFAKFYCIHIYSSNIYIPIAITRVYKYAEICKI